MQFFCVTRRQTPDTSQWNIGCVGSLALGLCVGHVHFIFFVLISFASDTRRKPVFQWNMGLSFPFIFICLSAIASVMPAPQYLFSIASINILLLVARSFLLSSRCCRNFNTTRSYITWFALLSNSGVAIMEAPIFSYFGLQNKKGFRVVACLLC